MKSPYLDKTGLSYLWQKIKGLVNDVKTGLEALATTTTPGRMSAADKEKLDGISPGANNYSHPTTSGNKHIPAGGASGQILRWGSDGTATWGDDNDTKTTVATSYTSGGSISDNTLYVISVDSAITIPANAADVCPVYGAHFILNFTADATITLNCLSVVGDTIADAASGETWEISVLRGRCVVKKVQEA